MTEEQNERRPTIGEIYVSQLMRDNPGFKAQGEKFVERMNELQGDMIRNSGLAEMGRKLVESLLASSDYHAAMDAIVRSTDFERLRSQISEQIIEPGIVVEAGTATETDTALGGTVLVGGQPDQSIVKDDDLALILSIYAVVDVVVNGDAAPIDLAKSGSLTFLFVVLLYLVREFRRP